MSGRRSEKSSSASLTRSGESEVSTSSSRWAMDPSFPTGYRAATPFPVLDSAAASTAAWRTKARAWRRRTSSRSPIRTSSRRIARSQSIWMASESCGACAVMVPAMRAAPTSGSARMFSAVALAERWEACGAAGCRGAVVSGGRCLAASGARLWAAPWMPAESRSDGSCWTRSSRQCSPPCGSIAPSSPTARGSTRWPRARSPARSSPRRAAEQTTAAPPGRDETRRRSAARGRDGWPRRRNDVHERQLAIETEPRMRARPWLAHAEHDLAAMVLPHLAMSAARAPPLENARRVYRELTCMPGRHDATSSSRCETRGSARGCRVGGDG